MDRMKALARLKEKRGESKMSDGQKDAKRGLLQSLIGDMSGMMAGPMKKVTVAADSKEGLKHGLDKAKEIVGKPMELMGGKEAKDMKEMPEGEDALPQDEKQGDEEMSESAAEESAEGSEGEHEEDMSPEELDAEIARLMEIKKAKLQKE